MFKFQVSVNRCHRRLYGSLHKKHKWCWFDHTLRHGSKITWKWSAISEAKTLDKGREPNSLSEVTVFCRCYELTHWFDFSYAWWLQEVLKYVFCYRPGFLALRMNNYIRIEYTHTTRLHLTFSFAKCHTQTRKSRNKCNTELAESKAHNNQEKNNVYEHNCSVLGRH